jgi:threonine dehydrogenase-like Zn-dependent dehydrogenase
MPRELIATEPRQPQIRAYSTENLGAGQIRIRSELATPKHGTELVAYRGDPVAHRPYDAQLGAIVPRSPEAFLGTFPRPLGNMTVGTVIEIAPDVTRFAVGDRVFGHLPIREIHTVDASRADPLPDGLTPEAAICLDPVVMALAMRDIPIRLGDRVAVFGLGAIGLICVQLARLAGAAQVIAVDPIAPRRALAMEYGADAVLDTTEEDGDTGLAIRLLGIDRATLRPAADIVAERIIGGYTERDSQANQLGVDIAIETTGNTRALHQAMRATRYGGTIGMVSFYGREASGLLLGEEFHINRLQLISVRAESLPMRDYPAWNLARLVHLAIDWMREGRIRTDGLLSPIVPFEASAEAYREIDEHPERSIKLGIRFD